MTRATEKIARGGSLDRTSSGEALHLGLLDCCDFAVVHARELCDTPVLRFAYAVY